MTGLVVIKLFSCSTQLSLKFQLLITILNPTHICRPLKLSAVVFILDNECSNAKCTINVMRS